MANELKGKSVAELDAWIETAKTIRQETRERRRMELKDEIENKLKAEGFAAIEVLGAKLKPKSVALPPRYADTADPTLTWSGKGRMPGWLQAKIDTGAALDSFLIK